MHPRRERPRVGAYHWGGTAFIALWLTGLTALGAGCAALVGEDTSGDFLDVERPGREEGDVEGEVGAVLEVYGITATVLEVGRVEAYNDIDTSGYIWARVRFENTTNRDLPFHRRHWKLEKPDGSLSNTATISTESQLASGGGGRLDVLPPGESTEGQVIYTVGDLSGQFAILYVPDSPTGDPLDRQRGVWIFESSPETSG